MTSRERILAALSHQEPDRIPVDLASTDVTSILYGAYRPLRERLGLTGLVKLYVPEQLLPRMEQRLLELAGTDAEPVEFQPTGWVESTIPDGELKLVPVECVPEELPDSSWVIRNADGDVTARLAEGAPCFRQVRFPLADVREVSDLDEHQDDIEAIDACTYAPMDFEALGQRAGSLLAGSDISFWGGGCDTQRVLPFGTPSDVRDEVRRRVDDLAPGGGFVFSHIHNIQPGTPPENILAMYETINEYR